MPHPAGATRAAKIHVASGFAFGVLFMAYAVAVVVYWVEVAELDPLQLVLTGTALELSVLVAEVPTGVVADLYSRKWSVVLSYLMLGAAMALVGFSTSFAAIALAQVLLGVGHTFQSGADTAWMTDEVDDQERADRLVIRHARARLIGAVVGALVAIGAGSLSLAWTIRSTGAATVGFAFVLAAAMPETRFHRSGERATWRGAGRQAARGWRHVRARPIVVTLLAAGVVGGLAGEAIDRLWVLHLIDDVGLPDFDVAAIIWTGGLQLVALTMGAVLLGRAEARTPGRAEVLRVVAVLLLGAALGTVTLALAPIYALAAGGFIAQNIFRNIVEPLAVAAINRETESEVRATVLSLFGQADALGQIVGGVVLGIIAASVGVPAALVVSAGLLFGGAVMLMARRSGENGRRSRGR